MHSHHHHHHRPPNDDGYDDFGRHSRGAYKKSFGGRPLLAASHKNDDEANSIQCG